jgi:dipeptidase
MRIVSLLVLICACICAHACTTILVGSKASADGSVFIGHSSDGGGATDPRLVRIPAAKYQAGMYYHYCHYNSWMNIRS